MKAQLAADKNHKMILAEELAERQRRNGNYSLRAYARSLGVAVSLLSEVLNGHRGLSRRSALKIAEALALAPEASEHFLRSALGLVPDKNGQGDLELGKDPTEPCVTPLDCRATRDLPY